VALDRPGLVLMAVAVLLVIVVLVIVLLVIVVLVIVVLVIAHGSDDTSAGGTCKAPCGIRKLGWYRGRGG